MPFPGIPLELQVFKVTFDSLIRYRVTSGLHFYMASGANQTLMQLRRKYLEPTNLPGGVGTFDKQ